MRCLLGVVMLLLEVVLCIMKKEMVPLHGQVPTQIRQLSV